MKKRLPYESAITISIGIPSNITCEKLYYKPLAYSSYETQKNIYLDEIKKFSTGELEEVDISFLKELLEQAKAAFESICRLPQNKNKQKQCRLKAHLYNSLAIDLKHIASSTNNVRYHVQNIYHKETLEQDLKELYTMLIMLYAHAIIELEKVVYQERKQLHVYYYTDYHSDSYAEYHFASCLKSIDIERIFTWIRQKISRYYV